MSVKIRLKRMGSKRRPFYRIVVADSRNAATGRFIETVGTFNPLTNPKDIKFDEDKIVDWMKKGAQPSDTVRNMLQKAGVMKKLHEEKFAAKK